MTVEGRRFHFERAAPFLFMIVLGFICLVAFLAVWSHRHMFVFPLVAVGCSLIVVGFALFSVGLWKDWFYE